MQQQAPPLYQHEQLIPWITHGASLPTNLFISHSLKEESLKLSMYIATISYPVPVALLVIQLPANVSAKAAEDEPGTNVTVCDSLGVSVS